MNLPHGNSTADIKARIELRAYGILYGHHAATDPDSSDINYNGSAEIEAAKELAAKWQAGEWARA